MFRKITLFGVILAFVAVTLGTGLQLSGINSLSAASNNVLANLLADHSLYSSLGLSVVVALLGLLAWQERHCRVTALLSCLSVLALIVAQGYLGLWTTANHRPLLLLGHLLLGMLALWCLFWLYLRANPLLVRQQNKGGLLASFAMLVLLVQIVFYNLAD